MSLTLVSDRRDVALAYRRYGPAVATSVRAPRIPVSLDVHEHRWWEDEETLECVELRGDATEQQNRNVTISESRMVGLRLTGSTFGALRLTDCSLQDCELSGVMLEGASWNRVELVDCRLSGTVLSTSRLRHVRFVRCRLDSAALRMISGESVAFEECDLTDADLSMSQLTTSRFHDCNMQRLDVSQARLAGTELHGSDLDGMLGASSLAGVRIDPAQIVPAALLVFGALGIAITDQRES